jgi:hypothetical protein
LRHIDTGIKITVNTTFFTKRNMYIESCHNYKQR